MNLMTTLPQFAVLSLALGLSAVACASTPPSPTTPAPAPSGAPAPAPGASASAPAEGVVCTMEVKRCPDGTEVGRTGPRCEFVCPTR